MKLPADHNQSPSWYVGSPEQRTDRTNTNLPRWTRQLSDGLTWSVPPKRIKSKSKLIGRQRENVYQTFKFTPRVTRVVIALGAIVPLGVYSLCSKYDVSPLSAAALHPLRNSDDSRSRNCGWAFG